MKPISHSSRTNPPRSLRLLAGTAVLATTLLTLSACGDDEGDKDADTKTEPTSQSSTPTDVATDATDDGDDADLDDVTSSVELVDAGSGDMAPLRLNVAEGQVETWTMEMTNDTEVMGQKISLPMSFTMTSTIDDVDEDTIESTLTYDDIKFDMSGVPGMPAGTLDQVTDALKGMKVEIDYDHLGAVVDSDFTLPPSMPAEMSSMMDQMSTQMLSNSVPFPAEEVGVGAKWTADNSVTANGLTMQQSATYELVAREGDDYTIKIDNTMTPKPGATMEGVEIKDGTTTLTGTVEGNLTQLGADGTMDTVAKMTMAMAGQEVETTSTVHMEITVTKN